MKVTDLKEGELIHCPTIKEANKICQLMHESGLKWKSKKSYLEINNWFEYKELTCYSPITGTFYSLKRLHFRGYSKIYTAKSFLRELKINKLLNEIN